jgi:hypothetical protein
MKKTEQYLPLDMKTVLAIQEEHLKRWDSVLQPEVAAKLRQIATKDNATTKNPYDIVRGDRLYEIVANQMMKKN